MSTRALGAIQVAVLLISASYGIGFLFGSGEMALSHGMAGALYGVATAAGMLVLALFARPLWARGVPIWDLFGQRFGKPTQSAVAVLSLVWMAGVLAAQIHGGAAVMRLLGLASPWDHVVVLLLIYVATQLDLSAASRVFAACLLASGLALAYALFASEGLETFGTALPRFVRDLSTLDPVRALTAAVAVSVLACLGADYHQFVVAARRPVDAVVGCVLAGLGLVLLAFLPPAVVIAMEHAGALADLADAKQVMPFLLARVASTLGPGADIVLLAALSLAALGSGAAIARAMTSALAAVAPARSVRMERSRPVIALAIGAALAARGQGIIDTMVSVNVIYIASVAIPFVALIARRAVPNQCATAAMVGGLVASLAAYGAGWMGLLEARIDTISLLAGLAGSLLAAAAVFVLTRANVPPIAAPRA